MRVLILGKNGMLGHDMEKVFVDTDVIALSFLDLDITDKEAVFEKLMTIAPDILINCTGYTDVDGAEKDEEKANEVNGYGVGVLARACREIDATLVHFSSDYVFHGDKKRGYNEDDSINPINAYGRSKALGEQLILDEMESIGADTPKEGKFFIIRTSWLYGLHGKNFVETMLELGNREEPLRVVDDQFGKPTYTLDLCEQVKWLALSHEYPSGIYHVTNEGATTWFRFAKKIFELSKVRGRVIPCTTDEFKRPARRPKFSALTNNMLPKLRPWEEALADYLRSRKT
ncbi:dTDP-4-dehydrorhamnose reductase [Patescibacteria group bacterium]|nr:dTDP-4-dehydrorhamnose reductase [Patescibacteria group bacterium]MBU1703065.1 dTDP-4-dehydrorhamnose reductase [Patescibacteria group bacterium]MBU1954158.1 dTDP-4-dehydrorhamnose reductase [Patescibacteria group bacterium]